MKLSSLISLFAVATAVVPASLAHASGSLDGRSFTGVFLERGKTSGDADTITFKDGRFRSSACDRYGYSDAPYKVTNVGDTMRFETETQSAKYGKLQWSGAVRGGKLDIGAEEEDGRVEIVLRGEGSRVILDQELRTALTGAPADTVITPRAAAAFMASELVRQGNGTIQVSEPDEGVLLFGAAFSAS
jgi:hypothetical protein